MLEPLSPRRLKLTERNRKSRVGGPALPMLRAGGFQRSDLRVQGTNVTNLGALIIRMGLWGILDYNYAKEPRLRL